MILCLLTALLSLQLVRTNLIVLHEMRNLYRDFYNPETNMLTPEGLLAKMCIRDRNTYLRYFVTQYYSHVTRLVTIWLAQRWGLKEKEADQIRISTVSYTHLDVYKRQKVRRLVCLEEI